MSFQKGQQVRATTKIPIGKAAFVPRNMNGIIIDVQSGFRKKYKVSWGMSVNGHKVTTVVTADYLAGVFAY